MALQGGWEALTNNLTAFVTNLALAALVLGVTLWASGRLANLARHAVTRMQRAHPDPTIQGLVASVIRYGVIVIGLIAVLQQLGVQATSVIAVLGAASLAVGLALQGTLSNVAAGVMILVLRPYRVGDNVVINGQSGVVRSIDLFATKLTGFDGEQIFMPNGKAFGDTIQNRTVLGKRRITLSFGIDYEDDVERGRQVSLDTIRVHPKVMDDPAPWAHLTGLNDSSVSLTVRAWVKPSDYVTVQAELLESIKSALEAAGLSFPYPHQVDVPRAPQYLHSVDADAGDDRRLGSERRPGSTALQS